VSTLKPRKQNEHRHHLILQIIYEKRLLKMSPNPFRNHGVYSKNQQTQTNVK